MHQLTGAVLNGWSGANVAAPSARWIAQAADVAVSSIYYNFGGLEQLYEAAQERAWGEAERWCSAQLDAIRGVIGLTPPAFGSLVAALIDDWAAHRDLAFAWSEAQRLVGQDLRYLPVLRRWRQLWSTFWREVCEACGVGEHAQATNFMFESESKLHLLQWRRNVDRACLDELCQGWACWLGGRLSAEGPWRGFARNEALRSMPALPPRGGIAERIAEAAADTIARLGVDGLTHRAVAAQADVTLGTVSYNFRTSRELTLVAFETLYRRIVPTFIADGSAVFSSADEAVERALAHQRELIAQPALEDLLLAAARDPALAEFRPQLRYLRGRSGGVWLRGLLADGREVSPLDAALFSDFGGGQRRACIGESPEAVDKLIRTGLHEIRTMLRADVGSS